MSKLSINIERRIYAFAINTNNLFSYMYLKVFKDHRLADETAVQCHPEGMTFPPSLK